MEFLNAFQNNALLWLLGIPLIASPIIYLVGRICVRTTNSRVRTTNSRVSTAINRTAEEERCTAAIPARWLALVALLLDFIPLGMVAAQVQTNGGTGSSGYLRAFVGGVPLKMDGIGLLLAATALLLGALVVIFSMPYLAGEEGEEKFYALLTMMVGTIIGLGCANDLFNLWVWFETMAVSSYLLVAFYTHQRGALEAGVKYLVQSAVGSVLVLIAIAIVFSQARTLRLESIAAAIPQMNSFLLAAGALFVVGFGVKAAVVPLHTWLPDAHSQAPSGISAMLSGVVIEAGLVAMLRALGSLPGGWTTWGGLLLGLGALNMLVGNLMALRQTQVKRLLAYSSLSHVGYMLLGFGAAAIYHIPDAAAGGFFHLFTHALMKGLAFLAAGVLLYGMHISRGNHAPLLVDDLNGAAKRYPLAAFAMSVAVLALGGLPPLAGFMSKWLIFAGSVETRSLPVILLVVFAACNSVLSLGYYAPLVNRMYRKEAAPLVLASKLPALGARYSMAIPLVFMVAAVVVLGVWPGLAQGLAGPAANSLVSLFGGSQAASLAGW